jgi:thiol-disulfide isomerase/thioredoxin
MRWCLPLLLLAFSGCGSSDVGVLEGQAAPQFAALGLDGSSLGLEQLAGKPAVVVFWASWCGPCMAEVPHLQALTRAYGDRIGLLGVNMGEDPRLVQKTVTARGLSWPIALDMDKSLAARFRVRSIPLVLVLDSVGRIRYRGNGLPSQPMVLLDGLLGEG